MELNLKLTSFYISTNSFIRLEIYSKCTKVFSKMLNVQKMHLVLSISKMLFFLFFIYKDVSTLLLTLKYFTYLLRICIVNMLLLTC